MADHMKRKKKRTFNHGTGKFEESTPMGEDATTWWKRKLGMGDGKKGSGPLAKSRKGVLDSNIKEGGG